MKLATKPHVRVRHHEPHSFKPAFTAHAKRSSVQVTCKLSSSDAVTAQDASRRTALSLILASVASLNSSAALAAPAGTPVDLDGKVTLITSEQAGSATPQQKLVYNQNKRIQAQSRAPNDFPGFIREGFDVTVVADGYTMDEKGLIYKDFIVGNGETPQPGQEVIFNYTGYNESGISIDSSFRQGRPAQTRIGIGGLIPGFEEGIKTMRPGGVRRIIVPPALGPPVGPSTFFSAKQCEVFDVELLAIRTCRRRQVAMFSDVVCE